MKTARQARREARQLFRLCLVDGSLDEPRARLVVERILAGAHSGGLAVASHFQRLVRQDRARHQAEIASAVPLPAHIRAEIEASLSRQYGADLITSFVEDPSLIGGVRLTAGSDVYDGTVKGGLAALEKKFGIGN
jgi:F-type H+-transporting ATPase subunit delta